VEEIIGEMESMEERDSESRKRCEEGGRVFMIIISLNIRGIGGGAKAGYLRNLIGKEGVELICI